MVYKDIEYHDVEMQAEAEEIDKDLVAEVAFYKKEMTRMLGE